MYRHTSDTTKPYPGRSSLGCCPVLRADEVHDGTSGQRRVVYYWQLQYYNDAHDTPDRLKPSSFAQTLQEENDTFYATFPNAKPPPPPPPPPSSETSGMVFGIIPENGYHHGVGFFPPGCHVTRAAAVAAGKPDLSIQTVDLSSRSRSRSPKHHDPDHAASRSRGDGRSTISMMNTSIPQSPIEQIDVLTSPYWTDNDSPGAMSPCSTLSNLDDDPPTIDDVDVSDSGCEVEDDHRQRHSHQNRAFDVEDSPSTSSSSRQHGGSIQDLDMRPSQATGTWPALKIRRNGSGSGGGVSLLPPSNIVGGGESMHTLTTYGRRRPNTLLSDSGSTTPDASSSTSTQESSDGSSSSSNNVMRLSPLPSHRRLAEKKKTQTLACNFCRGRKIACGPPVPGTVERTCNQCQRRSLKCVFPTESRRGVRKKKLSTNAPNEIDRQSTSTSTSQSPLDTRGTTLEGEG